MFEGIFAWLMEQPRTKFDAAEPTEDRAARMTVIARATDIVSHGDRLLAGFLLEQMRAESAFSRDVQMCQCAKYACDNGRAHGLPQLHRAPSQSVETWWSYCGTDSISVISSLQRTRNWYDPRHLSCSFAAMGGKLVECKASWATKREERARAIARRLSSKKVLTFTGRPATLRRMNP
jgi:hypothetical protein